MSDGKIYYAQREDNYYLKFVGDVRVTLCTGLNTYIKSIFDGDCIASVSVDFTETTAVDSTTLGLLAKVALHVLEREEIKAMLIVTNASLIRLVESMGFDEIFEIVPKFPETPKQLAPLPCSKAPSDEARAQVIEAHKTLMSMNKKNMSAFSELVKALERESS